MMELQSSDLFCLRYPDHYISKEIRAIVDHIYEKPQSGTGLKSYLVDEERSVSISKVEKPEKFINYE
jgi:hypothetical protein